MLVFDNESLRWMVGLVKAPHFSEGMFTHTTLAVPASEDPADPLADPCTRLLKRAGLVDDRTVGIGSQGIDFTLVTVCGVADDLM